MTFFGSFWPIFWLITSIWNEPQGGINKGDPIGAYFMRFIVIFGIFFGFFPNFCIFVAVLWLFLAIFGPFACFLGIFSGIQYWVWLVALIGE